LLPLRESMRPQRRIAGTAMTGIHCVRTHADYLQRIAYFEVWPAWSDGGRRWELIGWSTNVTPLTVLDFSRLTPRPFKAPAGLFGGPTVVWFDDGESFQVRETMLDECRARTILPMVTR
jgi:hypothetical protein